MKWFKFINEVVTNAVEFFTDTFKGACFLVAFFTWLLAGDLLTIPFHSLAFNIINVGVTLWILSDCVKCMKKFPEYKELWK